MEILYRPHAFILEKRTGACVNMILVRAPSPIHCVSTVAVGIRASSSNP